MQKPSLGRKVLYMLTDGDVLMIEQRTPYGSGGVRNPVRVGQVYPAEVVAVFHPEADNPVANLVVQLDGLAQHWATSRAEGTEPGTWHWPPRI